MPSTEASQRLSALRKLLGQGKMSSQDKLREELEGMRFKVTQSTVSRDLRRLGAIRAVTSDGQTVYRLPDEAQFPPASGARMDDLIVEISHNGAVIVIHTTPGSASLVARHLDHTKPAGILGTIAGDDTIFVAPKTLRSISETVIAIENSFAPASASKD